MQNSPNLYIKCMEMGNENLQTHHLALLGVKGLKIISLSFGGFGQQCSVRLVTQRWDLTSCCNKLCCVVEQEKWITGEQTLDMALS